MKLTEEDLSAQTDVRVHLDVWLKRHEWQQILDDYEKARKYDDYKSGNTTIAFAVDLNDNMVLSPALQKITRQNQKLRELIEKRIQELKLTMGAPEPKTIDELQKLLEESKE